jgi:hypothetical protein
VKCNGHGLSVLGVKWPLHRGPRSKDTPTPSDPIGREPMNWTPKEFILDSGDWAYVLLLVLETDLLACV